MATTLTKILLHVTFSTKHREPIIPESLEADLAAYTGGICRGHDSTLMMMGGTADHVHMLVNLGKTIALADLMLHVKRESSKWMKEHGVADFAWQQGYFAFSIGKSGVEGVRAYIARQKEHHAHVSYQDEMRAFFGKYGLVVDEKYVWE